ncbi:MAG: DNA polymerase/3'-5' exonuclease PolX [Syntrophomonadaceae bacterium]|nr:DNA polymerase/3'-5' exonuclease PolX [Syntrophomonadaceae bacterium]
MTNREIARIFDHIADLLQFKDENPFKVKAYRQAAHYIYHLDEDLQYLYEKKRLDDIPGVGKAIKAKIEEMLEKGSSEYYQRLLAEVPEGLLDMLAIPGVGYKTIKDVYEKLGIANRDELLQAARKKKIRTLPGMGAKTEYSIIKGIELLEQTSDKNTLGFVLPMAEALLDYVRSLQPVTDAALAGSIRRGKPLVTDIDIVAASDDEAAVRTQTAKYRGVKTITSSEEGHIKGTLQFNIPFELIIVPLRDFCMVLFTATGSKEHVAQLTARRGLLPSHVCRNEEEIYKKINLDFIPPELREDQGEIEAAANGTLPELVQLTDLKGDLHTHSNWSDGASKIAEMAEAARALNYSYIAVTDHSRSLPISGGLNEERLKAQAAEIDRLNQQWDDFMVYKGTEVDVLKDGRLDFSNEVLESLDIVVASIHTNFHLDKEKQTERMVRAIKNENVDIIGHLSGRLLNRRPPYELNFERVLDEAARNHVILEINSHPDRLDIDAVLARQAGEKGVKIAINSDAHHKNDLKLVKYGVMNARRGWLVREDVINTLTRDELTRYIKE